MRLRPILMTTAAMIGGMLPLALGVGEGGETQAPMGRAIIGGVITSTLLTLVVVPVLYTYLDGWTERRRAQARGRQAARRPPRPPPAGRPNERASHDSTAPVSAIIRTAW